MYNLMVKSYHNNNNLAWDKTEERSTCFKVTCKFTNVSWNWFHITVEDLLTVNKNEDKITKKN